MKNILFILCSILLFGCANECKKYEDEVYNDEIDNPLLTAVNVQLETIYEKINEPETKDLDYESYRLIYFTSIPERINFIRFDKKEAGHFVTFKDYSDIDRLNTFSDASFYKKMTPSQWEYVEDLFYQNDFWTINRYDNQIIPDGFGFIFEGHRPQAAICNKKTDQLIFRGSPSEGDQMRTLGVALMEFVGTLR